MGLRGATGGYEGLQGVTRGYRGLQGVTKGYKGLQGVTGEKFGFCACLKKMTIFLFMPWLLENMLVVWQHFC